MPASPRRRALTTVPAILLAAGVLTIPSHPPTAVRPGTRWWWDSLALGGDFTLADALDEVDAFADAGFGRFEIAWAPGTHGTPEQQADLAEVAKRAKSHDMQVDMTLGPGWPWSAPTTTGDLGQQELMYGREEVSGPTKFSGDVPKELGVVA